MDQTQQRDDEDVIDPVRAALLGLCTMGLATLFVVLLLADNASAVTF